MNRSTSWLLCCGVVTLAALTSDQPWTAGQLVSMYGLLGGPLLLHWGVNLGKKQ